MPAKMVNARNLLLRTLTLGVLVGLLAGCPTQPVKDDQAGAGAGAGVESRTSPPVSAQNASAARSQPASSDRDTGAAVARAAEVNNAQFVGHPLEDPNSKLAERIVYFDFDSASVNSKYRAMLDAHAGYLAGDPNARIVVEGHGDERGSREYNVGLGERRAQAVRRFLLFQGASGSQIKLVSYGEERPASLGHNEAAWAQNRRVELVYPRR